MDICSSQPSSKAPITLHLEKAPIDGLPAGLTTIPKACCSRQEQFPSKFNLHDETESATSFSRPQPKGISVSTSTYRNPAAPDDDFWESTRHGDEGVLQQVIGKASDIYTEVKDRAGDTYGDLKEKASTVWNTVAGVVGIGLGKELREHPSERFMPGEVRN